MLIVQQCIHDNGGPEINLWLESFSPAEPPLLPSPLIDWLYRHAEERARAESNE